MRRWFKRAAVACLVLATIVFAALAIVWHVWPFPLARLDRWPVSPVVEDREGNVLLRVVGTDDHWRLPQPLDRISPWLREATIATEDERFHHHHGADPIAVVRAVGQNLYARRTVSGASTLTMQICRMMDDRPRTLGAKLVETFRALQLERLRSKDEILETYLNIAPYGGNLRGVEAAARLYFAKSAADLSLAEATLLAGLPQSPARYRPDRHPDAARQRRRHVLARMVEEGMITPQQAAQAAEEPVITTQARQPPVVPHGAWLALQRRPAGGRTTISPILQALLDRLVSEHAPTLPAGAQIAAVVIDVQTAEIMALLGSSDPSNPAAGQVNGVISRRSPGSTLKPFIYAAAAEAGLLNADTVVYDVPINRAGWTPENFDEDYAGELPAGEALRRSLNVPAILIAEATGLPRCLGLIEAVGIDLPDNVQSRGGLSIVVGAIEVTLLDLVNGYATLARGGVHRPPRLFLDERSAESRVLASDVCAMLDDILSSHRRRPRSLADHSPREVPWFTWKTGTSSGRRDALAVGHNHRYAAGVWVGRFGGTGSPHFVGAQTAEPLLTAIFDLPAIRRLDAPPAPTSLPVTRRLPPPVELTGPVRILSPAAGATYVAMEDGAIVHPRANRNEGLTWFLNGKLLEPTQANRLVLPPGAHTLRCVDANGESAAVSFTVRTQPQPAAPR
ncbi:MAG: hypothetical protein AMXMBFR13_41910 [Phycisphaerae bacterium]